MQPEPYSRYLAYWDDYVTSFIEFALTGFAVLVAVRSAFYFYTGELPGFILFLPAMVGLLVPFFLHQMHPQKLAKIKRRQLITVSDTGLLSWLFSYPYKFFWISFALGIYCQSFIFDAYSSELSALLFIASEYYQLVSEFFMIPLLLFFLIMGMSAMHFLGNKLRLPIGIVLLLMLLPLFAGAGMLRYIDAHVELRQNYIAFITNMIGVVSLGWVFQIVTIFRRLFKN